MNDDMLSPQSLSIEPLRRDRIAAISSAAQRRPIVLVVGVHRSGTSLCAHILSALGIDMADEIGVNRGNEAGRWERWEIVEFHDRILGLFNRDYLGRFHDFALPLAWWADPRVAQIRREIIAFLQRRMGMAYFGFKDPRTVRLMPVWHQIFNELKLAPRVVLCLRNPVQVARSLQARDGLDPANGEYRWLVHMIDFYRYASKYDSCVIEYEEWFCNPSANLEKLQEFLDLSWQQSEADLGLVLSDIIDSALWHDDSRHREAKLPLVRTLYNLARDTDRDEAREKIGYIVSQFISFQQLQSPFQQVFQDVAETAAKFAEIEREAAALRLLVDDRDAGIASAEARASAAEARLAGALAENEAHQAQLAYLTRERDGHAKIERELNELKVTLAEREKSLAEHSRRGEELGVALQAEQAQVATYQAALLMAEQKGQERDAAMESEIAASTKVWNDPNESLEGVIGRIHDGVPVELLEARGQSYVDQIFGLFPYARPADGASIMEIGSGVGYIMEAMDKGARARGITLGKIMGLDIAEHMLERAKSRLSGNPIFSFVRYDGLHVPLPDSSLDLIYSVACLQHVPKPYVYNLFFEIRRLLNSDGHAVVHLLGFKLLPKQEKLSPWRDEIRQQIHRIEGHWHHFYSVEELQHVLHASGFKHIDIRDGESIWFLVRSDELAIPSDFNPDRYLELNPDVAGGADPAGHWKEYGYREGRRWK
jgi:ubiquinone/menaquinone biosynthesis C-methylase UbiE